MKRMVFLSAAGALVLAMTGMGVVIARAKPISYKLPEETATFKTTDDVAIVQNNCTACHSADYIQTQPRAQKSKRDFWQAEVTKMIKVYGAPIDEGDVGKIVDYLAANY